MLKTKYSTPAAASSSTRADQLVGRADVGTRRAPRPVTWRRKSLVAAVSSSLAVSTSVLSRLTVTSEGSRPTAAQCPRRTSTLWAIGRRRRRRGCTCRRNGPPACSVRFSPPPPTRMGGPPGWTGRRHVAGLVDPVVAPVERRRLLGEHGPADLQRLLQSVQPLAAGREVEAQPLVLDVVPGRADAEDGPPAADDVERRHDLGQVGGVAVGDAGDHGAEPHPRGPGRQRAEQGVGVEHGLARARPWGAVGRSGPSPRPSRSPSPRPRSPCATTSSKRAPGVSPAVKLGICSPKRMGPEPTGAGPGAGSSPPRPAAQPGQGHLALRGLERRAAWGARGEPAASECDDEEAR